eukprot:gnl/MRDRNA2_/MRDRNA2_94871_c0_seq1.p1 gnl/MRDRNA2_/MRDRNA2_94871_c0~~gnl/MRDRNA2_/MRDRNA2_94871_c0_seq1.p1  ORF type:complete len:274 (-),score=83.35 gnl/MRDRNA2_/MRDRNA2_94871_c0_seq1:61-882(-)
MMSLNVFFILVISASASRSKQSPGAPGATISPKCKEEVKGIQTKEKAAAVATCEEKAQYPQKAVAHLQNGDPTAAIATIEESFQTCAKFSETCAKELAPVVVQQLQFSGAAVSQTCRQSVKKVQADKKKMKEVATCEQQGKVVENVLVALNKNDIKSAVGAAQTGLEKCMGLSEKCAVQLAPVVVNQVVMRALMESQQQEQQQQGGGNIPTTTVFARASTLIAQNHPDKLSLIGTALDQTVPRVVPKKRSMSFLQKVRLPHAYVSRMILQMTR